MPANCVFTYDEPVQSSPVAWRLDLHTAIDFSDGEIYTLEVDWEAPEDGCTNHTASAVRTTVQGLAANPVSIPHTYNAGPHFVTLRLWDHTQYESLVFDETWGFVKLGESPIPVCCTTQLVQIGPPDTTGDVHLSSELHYAFNDQQGKGMGLSLVDTFNIQPFSSWTNPANPDPMWDVGICDSKPLSMFNWDIQNWETGSNWTEEGIGVKDCCLAISALSIDDTSFLVFGLGRYYGAEPSDKWEIEFDEFIFEVAGLPDWTKAHGNYLGGHWRAGSVCYVAFYGYHAPLPYGPIGTTWSLAIQQAEDGVSAEILVNRSSYTSNNKQDVIGPYDLLTQKYIKIVKSGYDTFTVYTSPDRIHWTSVYSKSWSDGMDQALQVPPIKFFGVGVIEIGTGTDGLDTDPDIGFFVLDNINVDGGDGCGEPEEECVSKVEKPTVEVSVNCSTLTATAKGSKFQGNRKHVNTIWTLTQDGKVIFHVVDGPTTKYKFVDLSPGNFTLQMCYIDECKASACAEKQFCVPCPCGGGDLSDFSELRLGPLVTLEDHKKALVDFETKFNQLVKALRGS